MTPPQGKEGKRNLRPKQGKGSNVSKQREIPLEMRDDKRDERKFVPWLGEARPKRGPIYDVDAQIGKKLSVVFLNGRVIEGVLDSCDRAMNLVFVETVELLDDNETRELGKVFVCGRVESMSLAC